MEPWWNVALAAFLIPYSFLFFVGTVENVLVLIVTITNRQLRSMFNYLFACYAFFQIVAYSGIPVFIASTAIRMTRLTCASLSAPSSIALLALAAFPLVLTIDRLIATCTPNQYKMLKFHEHYYIAFLVAFPSVYAAWNLACAFFMLEEDLEGDPDYCLFGEAMGDAYILFEMTSLGLLILVIPMLLFVNCQKRFMDCEPNSSNYQLFRALAMLILISLTGTFLSHAIHHLIESGSEGSLETMLLFKMAAGIVVFSTQCLVVPVFCALVRDYRVAFCKLFGVAQPPGPPQRPASSTGRAVLENGIAMRNVML